MCRMGKRILLTGRPGCGKTTLIQRVVRDLALPAGGFYTKEIRERGVRVGFKLITLNGKKAVFAHVRFKTSERVGKYGLDLAGLETVAVPAIHDAVSARHVVVIDEIGPMEIRSATFRDAVNEAFQSDVSILATIVARSLPFTDAIKKRSDVSLVELRPDNRQQVFENILGRFKAETEQARLTR
jgi:nucleoside-triphosphatase